MGLLAADRRQRGNGEDQPSQAEAVAALGYETTAQTAPHGRPQTPGQQDGRRCRQIEPPRTLVSEGICDAPRRLVPQDGAGIVLAPGLGRG